MTIETQVTWNKPLGPADPSAGVEIRAKVQELKDAGKQVGNIVINDEGTQNVVSTFWIDISAADEWIDFINGYSPVSAVVVNN